MDRLRDGSRERQTDSNRDGDEKNQSGAETNIFKDNTGTNIHVRRQT